MTTSSRSTSSIGWISLVCLIIGNMIGSGVYVASSYALGALGDARLVLVAWLIGGLHAICGAVAYAALARRVRLSGGEYAFLARYVHPAVGLMAGWISLTAGFAAPVAAAALVFGEYMLEVPEPTFAARCVATGWVALCALFHCINLRTGSWVNNAVVGLKLIGFLVFAGACMIFLAGVDPEDRSQLAWNGSLLQPDTLTRLLQPSVWLTIVVQLFFISLSYTGFNASIYIADEVHDTASEDAAHDTASADAAHDTASADAAETQGSPSAAVWQSMIAACVLVTAIYIGLNYLFLACSTPQRIIDGGDYFVSNVAFDVGGEWLRWVMRATIAISSATSVLAMTATGPRVYVQMARDGWLPRWFAPDHGIPRLAILVQAVATTGFVWLASVKELIEYLGLTLTGCGALATSTLWFAYRSMNRIRPVRWWEHAALALYIAGTLVLCAAAYQVRTTQFWLGAGTFAIGVVVYIFSAKKR